MRFGTSCFLALFLRFASATEVDVGSVKPYDSLHSEYLQNRDGNDLATTGSLMANHESHEAETTVAKFTFDSHRDGLMKGLRGRRLRELNPNSSPENNPHSIRFRGYNSSQVEIKEWMVEYLMRLNEIRLEEGVSNPLCFNEILMQSAQKHMDDMIENDEELMISHKGSDGLNSGQRITRDGYSYTYYGATIFAQTDCLSLECALSNRPLFFSERGLYTQFGIAKEYGAPPRGPRWYYIFASSDVDNCMGLDVNKLEWPAGTPTRAPVEEAYLPPPIPGDGSDMVEEWMLGLLALLNAERTHAGVPDFGFNKRLMLAAEGHNQDMVDHNYYSHQSLNGTGPGARATETGYALYSFMAENLATGEPNFRSAMFSWMSSKKGHGYNIINPNGLHIGVARDEDLGLYTLVIGNYQNDAEKSIPSIQCAGTISYVSDDPLFDKYACSYCRQRKDDVEFGNMGCGFGIKWYKTGNLKLKLTLYLSLDFSEDSDLFGADLAKCAASIEKPIQDELESKGDVNATVALVSIDDVPVGNQRRLQANSTNYTVVDLVLEVEITTDCLVYSECHSRHFIDGIQNSALLALKAEIDSGALTNAIHAEAVKNNAPILLGAIIDADTLALDEVGVEVEEDELHLTSFPTAAPTSAPTETWECLTVTGPNTNINGEYSFNHDNGKYVRVDGNRIIQKGDGGWNFCIAKNGALDGPCGGSQGRQGHTGGDSGHDMPREGTIFDWGTNANTLAWGC